MKSDRELLEQALNAFESGRAADRADVMIALRERLAQPEQEPFEYWNAVEGWVKIDEVRKHFDSVGCGTIYKTAGEDRVPLYTAPPQRKQLTEDQEPVAYVTGFSKGYAVVEPVDRSLLMCVGMALYRSPPK